MTIKERTISIAQLTGIIVFFAAISTPILYVSAIKQDVAVQEERISASRLDIAELKSDIKVTRSLVEMLATKQNIDIRRDLSKK
jgi:hypothetical protein